MDEMQAATVETDEVVGSWAGVVELDHVQGDCVVSVTDDDLATILARSVCPATGP
jgi:hypothetical protein